MKERLDGILQQLAPGECIGLDAEFTGFNEMLELAVTDVRLTPVFTSLFRPVRSRRWSPVPHGITPEMVRKCPRFAWRVPRVQRIIDRARFLIGFALENDISHLRAEGVKRLDSKRVLDLRDWFWLIHGRHHGFDYREGVSLALIIARLLDADTLARIEVDGGPHRAGYDTLTTLMCFRSLLDSYIRPDDRSFDDVVERFDADYKIAMRDYLKAAAAGHVSIVVNDEGEHLMKANKLCPDDALYSIAVPDRGEAMEYFAARLLGRHRTNRIILTKPIPQVIAEMDRYVASLCPEKSS